MRALVFLVAHVAIAAGLVAIGLSIVHAFERAQPTVLVDAAAAPAAVRDHAGTIICQPVVGPKPGARSTPREIA